VPRADKDGGGVVDAAGPHRCENAIAVGAGEHAAPFAE